MSNTPEEPLFSPLQTALLAFTGCIGEALDGICSYGLTIGNTYVPFDPDPEDDCEDDEAACSQVWVRVENASVGYVEQSFGGGCGGVTVLSIEVGVLRCIEVAEGGEAPTASQVMVAALQSMEDMNKLLCAALACDAFDSIEAGQWNPTGPLGGQYGGNWTFTVEV